MYAASGMAKAVTFISRMPITATPRTVSIVAIRVEAAAVTDPASAHA